MHASPWGVPGEGRDTLSLSLERPRDAPTLAAGSSRNCGLSQHLVLIRGSVTSWAELHGPIRGRTRPQSDISVPTGSAAGLGTGEMEAGNDGGERGAEGEDSDGRGAEGANAKGSLPQPPRQPLVLKSSDFSITSPVHPYTFLHP